MFQAPKLTNAGKALYYENMAGTQIVFTTIKLGSGTLSGTIANLTDLVNTVITMDAAITVYDEYVDVAGAFSNADLTTGFYWREIGVFAQNPDDPDNRAADILYCYQNAYDTADFIPAASVETVEKNITVPVIVGDTTAVSCALSKSLIYATRQDLEDHNNDQDAHGGLRALIQTNATAAATAQETAESAASAAADAASAAASAQETAGNAASTAAEAKQTADDAMEAVTTLAHTIDAAPSQSGSLTYTGGAQSPTWNNYNTEKLTIGGATSGTNAGTYTATFTPKEGYTWSDGTDTAQSVTWTIGRASISTTPSQSGSLTYTGGAQSPAWSDYSSAQLTIGGDTSGTNAGTYTATFTPTSNYKWSDGTTAARSVTWTIGRVAISAVPSQSGSLTYTGSAQSPTWSDYSSAQLAIGGDTSGTNAGTYTATFTPTGNYKWSDGTTTAKSVTWTIAKAAGSLSIDKTTMTLTDGALTGTITVTRAGDGAITAQSSNTGVATVSVSGNTVTVTGAAYGTATITVNVAAGTNYTAPASKTCSATVKIYSTTLNSNTWAQIREVSDAGTGANYWSVGDTKTITINGTVRNTTFSSLSVDVFILGFNHNSNREGANRIHFQIGKISGTPVALVDSNYGSSVSSTGYFSMNSSDTNSGGWNSSQMRTTLLGSNSTPTSPTASTLLAALPSDLRAVMKSCTKYSDNTGGGSDTAGYVTSTTDYLFLLSEWEYHGARTYANSAEQNYQAQYAYYQAGNSKIKYKHNATGTAANVWCRSVGSSNSYGFCLVYTDGSAYGSGASYSYGVAPGFCA